MLTVAPGVPFEVSLGSAPSTGYQWQLPTLPAGIELVGSDFSVQSGAAIGDGGTQVFHLRTTGSGHFKLHFELKRRWEQQPVQTQVIEVESR